MSGVAENILCGIVVEVLKTCFVYGNKWIQNYCHAEEYKEQDAGIMQDVVNKLTDIRDFYVEFWCHIPNRDRIVLGKCLKHIHSLLCDDPAGQNLVSIVIGSEKMTTSNPASIYELLRQYGTAIERTSLDSFTSGEGTWGRVKKEMGRTSGKFAYALVGRERHAKLFRMLGEWIDKIDDLISLRSMQLILRGVIASGTFARRVQSFNLPNTSNGMGLLLTNLPPTQNVENDTTLNPVVMTFNRETISILDNSSIVQVPSADAQSAPNSAISLGQGGNRHWAIFSHPSTTAMGVSIAQHVIVEFKPISAFDASIYDVDLRNKALREARSLIRALHIGARDPDKFHVLDCLGLFEERHAIGIIFKLPFDEPERCKCQTLYSLLSKEAKSPLSRKLDNRICLAASLAWSLSKFHLAKWVHKSFSSDNILLFPDMRAVSAGQEDFLWASPYLVGFELARPALGFSDPMSRNQPIQWRQRAYIHPDRLRDNGSAHTFVRFTKRHDIYSLGVVLLELGLLCPVTASKFRDNPNTSKNFDKLHPSDLWKKFQAIASKLAQTMGSIYAEVTLRCLEGDFGIAEREDDDEDTVLTERFIAHVCERLQLIQV